MTAGKRGPKPKLEIAASNGIAVEIAKGSKGNPVIAGGVTCPHCKGAASRVMDSRGDLLGSSVTVRRRRLCDDCGTKFSTYELQTENAEALLKQIAKYKADAKRWQIHVLQQELDAEGQA